MVLYLLCKHTKSESVVTSLALYHLQNKSKVVDALTPEKNQISKDIICSCKLECRTTCMLIISPLRVAGFFILKAKKARICKGYLYSNASHLMQFVKDIYRYVPVQINNISGDSSLLKLIGVLNRNSLILIKKYIWDTLDTDWSQIKGLVTIRKLYYPCYLNTGNTQI